MKFRISAAVCAVFLILLAIALRLEFPQRSKASPPQEFGVCVSQVPSSWGVFKGGSEQTGLAFEDSHGTLRFITSFPCNGALPPIALEVRRAATNALGN